MQVLVNNIQIIHITFVLIFFFAILQIILGNVNVSILNRTAKVQYKDDYEKFKLILNGIGLFMAIINLSFNSRLVELD